MRKKILNHTCILVVVSVLLTFLAAGLVMYGKYNEDLKESVRDSLKYVQDGVEKMGNPYLDDALGKATSARITLLDPKGNVLFDSLENSAELENHSNRPEFIQAEKNGYAESLRYSETLSKQNFYCAVKLADGDILRVGRTTDSVFYTMLSSSVLLGGLLILIFAVTFILVRKQTKDLIEPINTLNLEEPLKDVAYEELRPLLGRVDQQNKQIAKQMEELKEAEAVRREFSANVSHELRSPLTSMRGFLEAMQDGTVPQEEYGKYLGIVLDETKRMTAMVNDLLDLARIESGQTVLKLEAFDINELIIRTLLTFEARINAANIEVQMDFEAEHTVVEADPDQIAQVVRNLVDNAIKFSPKGGTLTLKTEVGKKDVRIYVQDEGVGIAPEDLPYVFDRFYKAEKAHTPSGSSTGIGLSIVKRIVEQHGQTITVESPPGKGTCFTFTLKLCEQQGKTRPHAAQRR